MKYIDFQKGKKVRLKFVEYEIVSKKGNVSIINNDNIKQKIEIDEKLLEFIDLTQPLTIELSLLTNSLLFISHDSYNLLDKLNSDLS